MGIVASLITLSVLVFFHELGHFLVARFFGVQVDVFSVGFGKKIYTKRFGTTNYCISAIPLGGYVQMKGQEDLDPTKTSQDQDSYSQKHPLKRLAILFAGPGANFLLAFVIYFCLALYGMQVLSPSVGDVLEGSPSSGILQKNDLIVSIDGQKILRWEEITEKIAQGSSTIKFIVKRNNENIALDLKPKLLETKTIFGETVHKKMIGISPSGKKIEISYSFLDSFGAAYRETMFASKLIFMSLVKMVEGVIGLENVGGIISIVDVTAKASSHGMYYLLILAAIISVNLGILNLLPIPALDGGHMVFVTYELITKKAPSEKVLYYLTIFGWACLFSLMFLGIYNDINRLWLAQ